MPNTPAASVRKADPRAARSAAALDHALIELVQERDFDDITVQSILERAGVGRTTFYAHYRNKQDVLHSSFDRLFSALDAWVDRPAPHGARLFPVAELLRHMATEQSLADALHRSGQMDDFWSLCTEHAARFIGRRLNGAGVRGHDLAARMLAGALVESLRWWESHRTVRPEEMDVAFHRLARGVTFLATGARDVSLGEST
jgi:AcrR family transcriptional regulator